MNEIERITGTPLERQQRGTLDDLRAAVDSADHPWAVIAEWYNYAMIATPPFDATHNDRYADTCPATCVSTSAA
ncbi:hypothetical protein [Streptomyces sp. 8N706]|uniref:hypothetical protein n=1 Tax=Streptomyces sp. 8N706 TaxID=3457416 RepID=UPI003FD5C755